ncbi:hypothetical protein ACFV23_02755 [Streptomyces sp. NPDC059627]
MHGLGRERGKQTDPVDTVPLEDGGLARADAVQFLDQEQGEPVCGGVGLDVQDTARVGDLRGGGRGDGDGRADTDADVDATGDRPQAQDLSQVEGGRAVVAECAAQVDEGRRGR